MRRLVRYLSPTVLLWDGEHGHRLVIEPEPTIDPASSDEAGAVTAAVYGRLEQYVRGHPSQWLKWKDLHRLLASDTGSLRDGSRSCPPLD